MFPTHQIISLDSRTQCGYPDDTTGYLAIIDPDALADQIPIIADPPPIAFVISGAPVIGFGFLEALQYVVSEVMYAELANAEEWVFNPHAHQSVLARLAKIGSRTTTTAGVAGVQSRVVMLSGDVHFGYSARLRYWADRPYGNPAPESADMVLAQLVGSSLRNERPQTDSWHREGFAAMQPASIERPSFSPTYPTICLGWANDGGQRRQVATRRQPSGPDLPVYISGTNQLAYSSTGAKTEIVATSVRPDFEILGEWAFDPRYFTLDRADEPPVEELEAIMFDFEREGDDFASEVETLNEEIESRMARIAGASIVGRNQIGEVTLSVVGGVPTAVHHGIYWRPDRVDKEQPTGVVSELAVLTMMTVSLEFETTARPFP